MFLDGSGLLVLLVLPGLGSAQESRSVFDAASVQLSSNVPPFQRLADFDLDGDVDAVGVQKNGDNTRYRVYYYKNDGTGAFSIGAQYDVYQPGSNPIFKEVGNLNGDAWPDLCILRGSFRDDWLRATDGSNAFLRQPSVPLPAPAGVMALADVDGDGLDDVFWMSVDALHLETSTGASDSIGMNGMKHGLRVLPGDGPFGSDVILAHVGNSVRIVYGHEATGLVAGPVFSAVGAFAMVDTGDVDGDGDVDAVSFGPTGYRVLRRLTPEDWSLEPALAGGPAEFLRDADGDGDLDGICCGSGEGGGGYAGNNQPSDFQISLNDGLGGFAPAFAIPGLGSSQIAGAADVDADGDIDLVAGRCVYFTDGPVRPLRVSAVVPPFTGPRSLSDCDADGDVDVGFSAQSVYSNDGTGEFALASTGAVAPSGTTFVGPGYPGDFDGDGDIDLVAELTLAGRTPVRAGAPPGHARSSAMALLQNDGAGGLAPAVPAAPLGVTFARDDERDPERSLLADVDQDGDLDLLMRTAAFASSEAETHLFANDGTGYFQDGGRQLVYRAVWAGDVDLDGDMDLVACGSGYDGTSTYLLLGSNPRPGRLPTLTWDNRPGAWWQEIDSGMAESDIDDDGDPDLACALTRETVFVIREALLLRNRFDAGASLAQHAGLERELDLAPEARIALGGLNGDASVDALIGPMDYELVDVCELHFQRTSGPALTFDQTFQLVSPGHLVDLDGDGDLDVLGEQIAFNRAP